MVNTSSLPNRVVPLRSRRASALALAAVAALTIAACGDDDGDAASDDTTAATEPAADTSPPDTAAPEETPDDTTVEETTAPSEPAAGSVVDTTETDTTDTAEASEVTETTDDAACREIAHEMGTACVPADPQRIVALDSLMALPTLIEVGAPVVGAVSVYEVGDPFTSYLDPADLADVEVVGSLQSPNLEAIAAADPDLIVGATPVVGPVYDQLQQIAPTVVTPYSFYSSTWLDDARLVADAAGRADEFEETVADLDTHVADTAATLAERGALLALSRIDMFSGTPLYYRFGCVWFGTVMEGAGVEQPEAQGPDDCTDGDYESVLVYLSLEELDVLDADAIVAYQQQADTEDVGASPLAALEASPLWTALPAVQSGDVFVLGDAWGLGVSVSAAHAILDDLVGTVFADEAAS